MTVLPQPIYRHFHDMKARRIGVGIRKTRLARGILGRAILSAARWRRRAHWWRLMAAKIPAPTRDRIKKHPFPCSHALVYNVFAPRMARLSPRQFFVQTAEGHRLAAEFLDSSGGNGTVIFVHGFCGSRREAGLFDTIASQCKSLGLNSIFYDWRGLGRSDGTFHSTTLDQHVDDFEQFVEWAALRGNGSVCAVGFSLGAAVVAIALHRGSISLRCAAFLSPAMRPSLCMWPRYSEIWDAALNGPVTKPGSSALVGRPILSSLRDTDLGEDAFNIGIPLKVYHGTADTRIECSWSRALATPLQDFDGFEYVERLGASHSLQPKDLHWGEVAHEVAKWMARYVTEERPSSVVRTRNQSLSVRRAA